MSLGIWLSGTHLSWSEHENEFGKWWDLYNEVGSRVTWVEQIDGLYYTPNGGKAYKTLRGAQRRAESLVFDIALKMVNKIREEGDSA